MAKTLSSVRFNQVPQGGTWSLLLFDLFVRKLLRDVQHVVMLSYADDTTILMRVPTGERKMCCAQLRPEETPELWQKWQLEFEAKKAKAIIITLSLIHI